VVALGDMPLANRLLDDESLAAPEPRFPLTLGACRACSLGQLFESVPPQVLFSDYVYHSSFSEGMVRHAEQSARELIASRKLGSTGLVVELGSNDGYQLRFFRDAGVQVLGIDPAANVARKAQENGIATRIEFFDAALGRKLADEGVAADVVLAYNVLAHVADLNGVVEGIRMLLRPGGVAVIEVPHVLRLLEECQFDTIYHEHLCYFSLTALRSLLARHDLEVVRVVEIPLHGGSLRVYAEPRGGARPDAGVAALERRERSAGLVDLEGYRDFAARVEALRRELVELIDTLHGQGRSIAAYGAAAKGATLLNFFGLGRERIDFVADRSTYKHGRYMPGVHVPIVAASQLEARRPDYCLLLAWNFAEEILRQQAAYRAAGGRFIVPIPRVRVL
jgi:SAM-dependent methyltransferase